MTQKIRKEGSPHETMETFATEVTIRCRGCKTVHKYEKQFPTELTCKCGYVIAKDGILWPSGENENG